MFLLLMAIICILTIEMTIQSIVEKYLKEACIDNICTDGGNYCNGSEKWRYFSNGDISNYDPNSPYEPSTDELKINVGFYGC